jgi:hypothetical protein
MFHHAMQSFLGVDPHWGLVKHIFFLCRNASKDEIHDIGGAIIFVVLKLVTSTSRWRILSKANQMVLHQGREGFRGTSV